MILFNIVFLLNYQHYQRIVRAPGRLEPKLGYFKAAAPGSRWNGN
jgi:hypothetical protein